MKFKEKLEYNKDKWRYYDNINLIKGIMYNQLYWKKNYIKLYGIILNYIILWNYILHEINFEINDIKNILSLFEKKKKLIWQKKNFFNIVANILQILIKLIKFVANINKMSSNVIYA